MRVRKLSTLKGEPAYNILCKSVLLPGNEELRTKFGSTLCEIEPGGRATKHSHLDRECFLILEGKARMEIEGESCLLEKDDFVEIPSQSKHEISNLSETESLKFLSLYWIPPLTEKTTSHTLVIPAPPTPNGALHVGHLSGPYLAADVFTRAELGRGMNAYFAMGTDDNQSYMSAKAAQLSLSEADVCHKFSPVIHQILEKFGTQISHFLSPLDNEAYTKYIQTFFEDLVARKVIVETQAPGLFSLKQNTFLYGSSVSGGCPNCKKPTGGNGCEACGHYNDCADLVNPKASFTDEPLEVRSYRRYIFPLSKLKPQVASLLEKIQMHPRLRRFYSEYLNKGLPDVSASHEAKWGIAVPGVADQVIYEWVEMAGAYLYLSEKISSEFNSPDFWRTPDASIVESFGFDNSFFYGLFIPVLLQTYDKNILPPRAFLSNEFYLLDGKKFSTSRNHAIWGQDILEHLPADPLRFYLALTRSEYGSTNFRMKDFENYFETQLIIQWESLFANLDCEIRRSDFKWPPQLSLSGVQEKFYLDTIEKFWKIDSNYSAGSFSLNSVARLLNDVIVETAQFFASELNLSIVLSVLRTWAAYAKPILPEFSEILIQNLGKQALKPEILLQKSETSVRAFDLKYFSNTLPKLKSFIGHQ